MTTTITPRERELARHALGLDGRRKRSYRNYFATGNDSGEDYAAWREMEQRSLAISWLPPAWPQVCFRLTRAGALAALDEGETLDEEEFPE